MNDPSNCSPQTQPVGLICSNPHCRGTEFRMNKKYRESGRVRRRYVCQRCNRSLYTYEVTSKQYHAKPSGLPDDQESPPVQSDETPAPQG